MSQRIFIENKLFVIISEHDELVNHAFYQSVKKEVYSERSPFSGGTDWEKVKQECEQLAREIGLDLAVSVYYTIASLKLDGLRGYANGLELIFNCLTRVDPSIQESDRQVQRLLRWANAQALIELQNVRASYEVLRYLYQCEQYCQRISYFLQNEHPMIKADFESIGYIIFEHIDRLEMCYQVALKRKEVNESKRASPVVEVTRTRRWPLVMMFLLGGLVSGLGYWLYLHHSLT